MPDRRRPPRRVVQPPKRGRRWILIGAGAIVLGMILWLGREIVIARGALQEASGQAQRLQRQITDGDTEKAKATLADLKTSTRDARTHTDGPLWSASTVIPFIGNSVDAVTAVSRSLDVIAQRGLPPVVEVSSSLGADVFKPRNGRFDVANLQELAPSVTAASEVLTAERAKIERIEIGDLVGPVKDQVSDLKVKISDAEQAASAGARAMRLAPPMLGADGKRKYLLLFQNNAEARSTGGLPGAWAILGADDGELSLDRQGSIGDVRKFPKPVVKLTKEEKAQYGDLMATHLSDVNFTPDFTRSAEIARVMIDRRIGTEVDGVISVDPVALQYLLKATGPVKVGGGMTLNGMNAVDILLNRVYKRFSESRAQDAFFAVAARRVFRAVTTGKGDSRRMVKQLSKASSEHRLLLWSSVDEEQASLAQTRLSGILSGAESSRPHLGFYYTDATQSKMQYYLNARTTAKSLGCSADGTQTIRMSTTLESTAPTEPGKLPPSVTGRRSRIPQGSMLLSARFFGPAGGTFTEFRVNGKSQPVSGLEYYGRAVNIESFHLKPGQSVRVEATVQTRDDQRGDAVLNVTPGVRPTENGVRVPSTCDQN